jgi:gluconokinase
MLIILFGLSGSGKNYVGEILAEKFNYFFWDADTVLPQDMRDYIKQKKSFTQSMRDNFTTIIIQHIAELQSQHANLVIAQAFYKEINRQQVLNAFPDANLIHIKAESAIIAARLTKNAKSIPIDYAEQISRHFENTLLTHKIITNNSDQDAVVSQLIHLLNSPRE